MADKIVLAYAKKYWNYGENPKDGIGLVSKSIYESLERVFPDKELVYLDFSEYTLIRGLKGIERVFTISAHIDKFQAIAKSSEINLISVNEHALMRRRVRDYAKRRRIPSSFLEPHDGIRSNLREINGVSNVIAFGSWNTFKSYEMAGFNPHNVYAIGWKYWDSHIASLIPGRRKTILCYLGSICIRKGVYEIEVLLKFLKERHPDYSLHLVGFVNNSELFEWLGVLVTKYNSNFKWTNERINYGEDNWLRLRDNVAFAIFPSWEEGLSGCLMDTINLGIPTFYSDRAGLEFSHPFLNDFDYFSDSWIEKIHLLIEHGQEFWDEIAEHQKRAAFFQYKNNKSIEKTLMRLKSGHLWPKVKLQINDLNQNEAEELTSEYNLEPVNPDYLLESGPRIDENSIKLSFVERNQSEFSTIDKFRMAVMTLDRYSAFNSLYFSLSKTHHATSLFRLETSADSVDCRGAIRLWVPSYHQGHAPNKFFIRLFYFSELVKDFFYLGFDYFPKRYANIIRLKIRKELKRISAFLHMRKRNTSELNK